MRESGGDDVEMTASSDALQILRAHSGGLPLHSVYGRTVNLLAGEGLVTVQPPPVPLTPLSVIVGGELFERLRRAVSAAGAGEMHGTVLRAADVAVDLRRLRAVDCAMPQSPRQLAGAGFLCAAAGLFAGRDSLLCCAVGGVPQTAEQRTAAAILRETGQRLTGNSRWEESLARLVGLGQGLTPAGDDFLVGVLAVTSRLALPTRLPGAVASNTDRTTDLSRAFLLHAAHGRFSQPVREVLLADGRRDTAAAVAGLAGVGHSSGRDALGGIVWALQNLYSQRRPAQKHFGEESR